MSQQNPDQKTRKELVDELKAVKRRGETAPGLPGEPFGDELEALVDRFDGDLSGKASADHDHAGDTLGTEQNPVAKEHVESVSSGELLLTQYASADDAPTGGEPGIKGVTDDGHILVEDGK